MIPWERKRKIRFRMAIENVELIHERSLERLRMGRVRLRWIWCRGKHDLSGLFLVDHVHLGILFIHTSCSSIHHVHPYNMFIHASCSSIHHVHPYIMFIHTTCSSIHHVHPYIIFTSTLFATQSYADEEGMQKRI